MVTPVLAPHPPLQRRALWRLRAQWQETLCQALQEARANEAHAAYECRPSVYPFLCLLTDKEWAQLMLQVGAGSPGPAGCCRQEGYTGGGRAWGAMGWRWRGLGGGGGAQMVLAGRKGVKWRGRGVALVWSYGAAPLGPTGTAPTRIAASVHGPAAGPPCLQPVHGTEEAAGQPDAWAGAALL